MVTKWQENTATDIQRDQGMVIKTKIQHMQIYRITIKEVQSHKMKLQDRYKGLG